MSEPLKNLYEDLTPILQQFNDLAELADEETLHAANVIACFFMYALQSAVEHDDKDTLFRLAFVVGREMMKIRI